MVQGLIVNIDVSDIEQGAAFYANGLGFAFERLLFGRTVAEMTFGNTAVYLIEQRAGSSAATGAQLIRDYAPHWTPVHLDIPVEHLEPAIEAAVQADATFDGKIHRNEWGDLAPLRDPFGHGVCLIRFHGAGYDDVAG